MGKGKVTVSYAEGWDVGARRVRTADAGGGERHVSGAQLTSAGPPIVLCGHVSPG